MNTIYTYLIPQYNKFYEQHVMNNIIIYDNIVCIDYMWYQENISALNAQQFDNFIHIITNKKYFTFLHKNIPRNTLTFKWNKILNMYT